MQISDTAVGKDGTPAPQRLSHRRLRYTLHVILRDPLALFSVLIIALLVFLALFGPWIAPYPEQGKGARTCRTGSFPPPVSTGWAPTNWGGTS